MGNKRRILTNTFANATAQIVALVASFVFMPLLMRSFGGVANYGLYMLAITISSYAYLLDFGVGTTLQKRIAESEAKEDSGALGRLASSALTFYVGVGLVAAIGIVALALGASSIFKVDADGARLLRNLLLVAAAQSLFQWPLSTANHILSGLQRYTILARTSMVSTFLQVAAMASVLFMHGGPLLMLVAVAATSLAANVMNWWFARKETDGIRISVRAMDWSTMHGILMFSWPLFTSQIVAFIVYQQTDRIVLATFVGAAAVGLYEAAGKFQGLIAQLSGFTNSAVMPMASNLDAKEHHEGIRTLFIRGTKYVLAVSLPVTLTLIVLARPLILHWLGPAFDSIVFPAQLIISHQLLTAGLTVGGNIAIGRGAMKERLPFIIAVAVENLALSIILVQRIGILGVVIGTVVPYYLDFPFGLHWSLKHSGTTLRDWLREVVVPVYPPLLACLAVGLAFSLSAITNTLLGTAAAACLSVGSYWLVFYFTGLSDFERDEFRSGLRAVAARVGRR